MCGSELFVWCRHNSGTADALLNPEEHSLRRGDPKCLGVGDPATAQPFLWLWSVSWTRFWSHPRYGIWRPSPSCWQTVDRSCPTRRNLQCRINQLVPCGTSIRTTPWKISPAWWCSRWLDLWAKRPVGVWMLSNSCQAERWTSIWVRRPKCLSFSCH